MSVVLSFPSFTYFFSVLSRHLPCALVWDPRLGFIALSRARSFLSVMMGNFGWGLVLPFVQLGKKRKPLRRNFPFLRFEFPFPIVPSFFRLSTSCIYTISHVNSFRVPLPLLFNGSADAKELWVRRTIGGGGREGGHNGERPQHSVYREGRRQLRNKKEAVIWPTLIVLDL